MCLLDGPRCTKKTRERAAACRTEKLLVIGRRRTGSRRIVPLRVEKTEEVVPGCLRAEKAKKVVPGCVHARGEGQRTTGPEGRGDDTATVGRVEVEGSRCAHSVSQISIEVEGRGGGKRVTIAPKV
ncbi:hypothetical protein SESBI_07128 [Sesbania bispinosa]|nr:hypothetical protein SESBI_07128 [Sesbania bispinosa]